MWGFVSTKIKTVIRMVKRQIKIKTVIRMVKRQIRGREVVVAS